MITRYQLIVTSITTRITLIGSDLGHRWSQDHSVVHQYRQLEIVLLICGHYAPHPGLDLVLVSQLFIRCFHSLFSNFNYCIFWNRKWNPYKIHSIISLPIWGENNLWHNLLCLWHALECQRQQAINCPWLKSQSVVKLVVSNRVIRFVLKNSHLANFVSVSTMWSCFEPACIINSHGKGSDSINSRDHLTSIHFMMNCFFLSLPLFPICCIIKSLSPNLKLTTRWWSGNVTTWTTSTNGTNGTRCATHDWYHGTPTINLRCLMYQQLVADLRQRDLVSIS